MGRNRVDDEEALIPRSDQEEYHPTVRKKKSRCTCCSVKCCFALFFALVLVMTILFYFVYPSVIADGFDKFLGYIGCDTDQTANLSISCIVSITSAGAANAAAIEKTWGKRCTSLYFIYGASAGTNNTEALAHLPNGYPVADTESLEYLDKAFDRNSTTTWYLKTDDTTYVSTGKLQHFLEPLQNAGPTFVSNELSESSIAGPYVLNRALVEVLVREVGGGKKDPADFNLAHLQDINVTLSGKEGLSAEFPGMSEVEEKVDSMTGVPIFHGLAPAKMYALYIASPDSL